MCHPCPSMSYTGIIQSKARHAGIPKTPSWALHNSNTPHPPLLPSWFFLPHVRKMGPSTLCSRPLNVRGVVLMLQWKESFILPHLYHTASSASFLQGSHLLEEDVDLLVSLSYNSYLQKCKAQQVGPPASVHCVWEISLHLFVCERNNEK